MPPAAAPAAGGPAGGDPQQPQQRGGGFVQGLIRMALMWFMMKQFSGNKTPPPIGKDGQPATGAISTIYPLLTRSTPIDMHMYISENENWKDVVASNQAIWVERDVALASEEPRHSTFLYRPSSAVQNNGSVYIHTVFTPPGASPNPSDDDYDSALTFAKTRPLNAYMPKRRAEQGVNLLSGKNTTEDRPLDDDTVLHNETVIVSYLKPNVTVTMVDEFSSYPSNRIPPHLLPVLDLDPVTHAYKPHIWFNEFWLLRDYLVPMNKTVEEFLLHLTLEPIGPWKFGFFVQMEQSFSIQQTWGMAGSGESDEVKRIFLEGNPYYLALTMFVSTLHSIFEVLAFKNDIGFWKNNKSMRGLSARTILINAVCQLIIFLYLLDNETSFVVIVSTGIGAAIEFWKVTKAMDVTVGRTAGGLPKLIFKDKASYTSSKTDQYDAQAMRYLSYVLYPFVGGYAIYSLVYKTHKSWYSWVLNSLVGAVYTGGFILMCPQLYLNYKLQSVAHLPWRQMTYKFLTTIVDDFFAFAIKMPLLHRLAVFRDDVVFLVYIYQRWIYRVDFKRVNEFGYQAEQDEEEEEEETQGGEEKKAGSSQGGPAASSAAAVAGSSGDEVAESKKEK